MYRIRIVVLGKNPGITQDELNIDIQHDTTNLEDYLVTNILASTDIKINLDCEENDEDLSECSLSSLESSSSTQNNLQKTNEEDGFIYLCGWLSRKFKNKYPHLSNYTKDNKLDHSYSTLS